jgi:hypothetical protein
VTPVTFGVPAAVELMSLDGRRLETTIHHYYFDQPYGGTDGRHVLARYESETDTYLWESQNVSYSTVNVL